MPPNPTENRSLAGSETSRLADWLRPVKKMLAAGLIIFVAALAINSQAQTNTVPAPTNGIAVCIVYDGSGSMKDLVPGANQQPTPKFVIANKAVGSIIRQLVAFSQDKHVPVQAGLVYFVDGHIHEGISLVDLTPATGGSFTDWTRKFTQPSGGTPLGLAIQAARHQLDRSSSLHKHILVITDGVSNQGISPDRVVHEIGASAHPIPVYFVAFDVAAKVFAPAKAEGATVVSASNEAQLNVEINHILGQKILLEAE